MSNFSLPFDDDPRPPVVLDADDGARQWAVDPTRNVVLEASAGTGKTRVLVERYVNLLRAGVDPANILAITFTRKAAAEMRQRILARLREAAAQSEADRSRWRELRERAGEIAISTIDAFCLSLLREFPLEADLDPGFSLADETEIPRFVDQALDRALRICRGLARDQESVALVFAQLTESSVRRGLDALLNRRLVARPALARFLERGPRDLTAGAAVMDVRRRLRATLAAADGGVDAFLESGPTDHPRYEIVRRDIRWLVGTGEADRQDDVPDPGLVRAAVQRIRQHFFTDKGQPRKQLTPHYVKKDFALEPDFRRHLDMVMELAPRVHEDIRAFQRDLNVVLSRGISQMFEIAGQEYARTLEAHAALDFSEVLDRAVRLLRQMEEFARSRYRLESRYHHVLVDEFQDTSRAQWELVSLLVKSWGEGFGLIENAPLRPSVFIVGDRKQSIYGFRDAEVGVLQDAREYIAALRPDEPAHHSIARSARAVPELLAFVNDVFAEVDRVERRDNFTYTEQDRFPLPVSESGRPAPTESLGVVAGDSPDACARGVALEVERLVGSATVRDRETGLSRPAEYGDVGILFRSRESHREFESALEARRIPSYVYKGLGFFDAAEIKDVVALLRYLANPESHACAAALLRSGFVRLSDRALQALRADVAGALGASHVPALEGIGAEDREVLTLTRAATARWRSLTDRLPPAELLDRIIGETAYAFELRGPRLAQARENLKKIRAIVRRVQNRGYGTMARLAAHLDRMSAGDEANALIDAVDAVSLMTVHAAKGLEFPIVFVVNLARGAGGPRPPVRVLADDGTGEPSVSVGDFESEADEDLKARDREESKRLLYVALTRARDRLYLSATVKEGVWRPGTNGGLGEVLPPVLGNLVARAAGAGAGPALTWAGTSGLVHTFRVCAAPPADAAVARSVGPSAEPPVVEDRFAPLVDTDSLERLPVRTRVGGDPERRGRAATPARPASDETPTLTGRLVHRLLQFASTGSEPEEADLARRVRTLAHTEDLSGVESVDAAVEQAMALYRAIRTHEVFRSLESETCLFEVPFSFRPAGEAMILRGAIDCLSRTVEGRLAVLEFKTGRPGPEHRAQLDIYVSAARAMAPGVEVEGFLIYP